MKRLVYVFMVLVLMVILTGCATTVKVRHLVPGEVDLQGGAGVLPLLQRPAIGSPPTAGH